MVPPLREGPLSLQALAQQVPSVTPVMHPVMEFLDDPACRFPMFSFAAGRAIFHMIQEVEADGRRFHAGGLGSFFHDLT